MSFEFKDVDIRYTVHHYDVKGVFKYTEDLLIEANTGLPANSTIVPLPDLHENITAVWDGIKWSVVADYRGIRLWSKDRTTPNDYLVVDVGPMPETHTGLEPQEFDEWVEGTGWVFNSENAQLQRFNKRRDEAEEVRDNIIFSDITVHGKTFGMRDVDRENLDDSIDEAINQLKLPLTYETLWTLTDDTMEYFTLQQLLEVRSAFRDRKRRLHSQLQIYSAGDMVEDFNPVLIANYTF